MKPAHEPVIVARKPLAEKTVARNVLAYGTGAINVDACRIEGEANRPTGLKKDGSRSQKVGHEGWDRPWKNDERAARKVGDGAPTTSTGRWPANVLLDQHAAAWVDEQSGASVSRKAPRGDGSKMGYHGGSGTQSLSDGHSDSGGASRFFKVAESDENGALSPYFPREFDDAFLYTAKAPKSERPNVDGVQHPTVKPLAIMRWLIRLVTPPGGTVLDPFAGSGTTIEAALIEGFDPVGIEMEPDYLPLIQHRIDRQAGTLPA